MAERPVLERPVSVWQKPAVRPRELGRGVTSVVRGKELNVWDIEVVLDPLMAPNTLSARVEGEMLQIRVAPGVKPMTLAVLHGPIAAAVAEAIDEEMSA
jgi:hypothetical protein